MEFNRACVEKLHRHDVVWLDKHIGELGNNQKMKDRFRRVTHPLLTFTEVEPVVNFIRQRQVIQRSVFLIVSGKLGSEIVPQIFDLECVVQIFVFCGNISNHSDWATNYIEKLLMFDSEEELLIRLTNEIAKYLTEEANRYDQKNQTDRAAALLDWADWLYNDADTLQRAACKSIRENIRKRREQLNIDH